MTVVFIASLIVGLFLGVRVMMFGVERPGAHPSEGNAISVRLANPAIAAFALVFGLLGYLLTRVGLATGTAVVIAILCGLVAAALAVWVVSRSARVVPAFDAIDPRYALQGQLAQVVRPIGAGEEGEIEFEVDSARRVVRARSVGEESVGIGADVVIDRIEDDVAYVEPWHQVEQRL